jgi:hypothetical protein
MSAYNCIILRTFVQTTIPDSLFEAAKIDGAGHFRIYAQIVLPLFKAGLATIGLFKVVGNWNDWFTGMLYIENPKLVPLQTLLDTQEPEKYLRTVDTMFRNYPEVKLTPNQEKRCRNGNSFTVNLAEGTYRAYSQSGEFLMLAKVEDSVMSTIKSFFEV